MPLVTLELEVPAAQELESTIRTVVKKIDWVLENSPPKRPGEAQALDTRAKILTLTANIIQASLHKRALENSAAGNVVNMKK